jgi:YHS domain-containing protein
MYGFYREHGSWEVMLHGNTFVQYLNEGGEEHRRGQQAGSINWFMGMARRPLGAGRVGVRGMLSLEPWTIPGCGYPVLLATGETCGGDTIHDRQHPHDLFMELGAEYDRPLTSSLRWRLYGGPAGEPALGPPGFPHRLSAMPNLVAPIGHHWLDATHITFGVVTTGVYGSRWKGEGSIFNGREPDERRTDFDLAPLDSYSGRIWLLPTDRLALQVSAGRLEEAEAPPGVGPREDVVRITSSATYHAALGAAGFWATTLAWGTNRETDEVSHAFTAETVATADGANTWFGRLEVAGKAAHDLHVHESDDVFTVGRAQGGYVRYLSARRGFQPGFGLSVSASIVPAALEARYGGRVVPGFGIFLTVRPAAHEMRIAAAPATPDPHAGHTMPSPAASPAAPATVAPPPAARAPTQEAGGAADRLAPGDPRLPVIAAERVIDPACAANIDLVNAPRGTYQGKVYYFCSTADRDEFVKDPEAYLKRRAQ